MTSSKIQPTWITKSPYQIFCLVWVNTRRKNRVPMVIRHTTSRYTLICPGQIKLVKNPHVQAGQFISTNNSWAVQHHFVDISGGMSSSAFLGKDGGRIVLLFSRFFLCLFSDFKLSMDYLIYLQKCNSIYSDAFFWYSTVQPFLLRSRCGSRPGAS